MAELSVQHIMPFPYRSISQNGMIEVAKLPRRQSKFSSKEFIEISEDLSWAIGFYLAEGDKSQGYLGASNTYLPILFRFRGTINKTFMISNTDWHAYIATRGEITENLIKNYIKILETDKINIRYLKLANSDVVNLRVHSAALIGFFNSLIRHSIPIILSSRKLMVEFIKGYLVGDGSITVKKDGLVHHVSITVKNPVAKDLLKEMYHRVYSIRMNERISHNCYEIYHGNVKGITNFILDEHFIEHKPQWEKFISSYKKKEYVRSHLRYWIVLKDGPLLIKEISEKVKRSHWSVREAMTADEKVGLVKTSHIGAKFGIHHNYKFYELTDKGEKLVNILSVIN